MAKKGKVTLTDKIYRFVVRLLSSNGFFYGVIALTVVQALWYALSFQPTIFDEGEHLGFITAYSHQLSPFIAHQATQYDFLGEITRSPSYLFYYIMSWPYRLVTVFTHSNYVHIIVLRLICICLFTAGIVIFRKVLVNAGASKAVASTVMLFVVLTPTFALLPGAVNYDNAVFLLTAVLLLLAVRQMKSDDVSFRRLSLILAIGLLGSLVKFEFLAFAVPLILYLLYDLITKQRGKTIQRIGASFKKLSLTARIGLVVLLVISTCLFIERPVYNALKYHAIDPSCTSLVSTNRCLKNYTAARTIHALANKPANFSPVGPFDYMLTMWTPDMVVTQSILLPGIQPTMEILRQLYYIGALGGGALVLVYLRDFLKNKIFRMLLIATASYTVILAAYNYSAYIKLGIPVAITGRYILPVLPIFIFFVALSVLKLFHRSRLAVLLFLAGSLLLFTQGGGMLAYVVTPNQRYYWPGSAVKNVNTTLKDIVDPFVAHRNVTSKT